MTLKEKLSNFLRAVFELFFRDNIVRNPIGPLKKIFCLFSYNKQQPKSESHMKWSLIQWIWKRVYTRYHFLFYTSKFRFCRFLPRLLEYVHSWRLKITHLEWISLISEKYAPSHTLVDFQLLKLASYMHIKFDI